MVKRQAPEQWSSVESVPNEQPFYDAANSIRTKIENTSRQPETFSKSSFKPEVLTSAELTKERIKEISDYFRFIFNNDWPQFVACPPCDSKSSNGMRFSAMDIFKTESHLSLEKMDCTETLPNCPHCGNEMRIFHDPDKTFLNLKHKLEKDGYVSLLRSDESHQIAGFTFGYGCTLQEEFHNEWRNRYHYMAQENPEYDRDFDVFIRRLQEEFPDANFTPESEVFCWNCVATSPEARSTRYSVKLMQAFFDSLPPEKRDLYVIGETLSGSNSHRIFKTLGGKDVSGILDGQDTIIAMRMNRGIDRLNKSKK